MLPRYVGSPVNHKLSHPAPYIALHLPRRCPPASSPSPSSSSSFYILPLRYCIVDPSDSIINNTPSQCRNYALMARWSSSLALEVAWGKHTVWRSLPEAQVSLSTTWEARSRAREILRECVVQVLIITPTGSIYPDFFRPQCPANHERLKGRRCCCRRDKGRWRQGGSQLQQCHRR